MALSDEYIDAHTLKWQRHLSQSYYKFRVKWPSRAFRHDPIEAIALILNDDELLSRNHSQGRRVLDLSLIHI